MKKILLILLLFIPIGIKALEPNYKIDGFYVEADIHENGDMLVKEQIVMKGSFNGYIRDLYYKGNYTLYDASDIQLNRVCEVTPLSPGNFDLVNNIVDCFHRVAYANPGDSHVYTHANYNDSISLKMFNYTENGTSVFYIEYLLKDVIVIHEDVAELYWTFMGSTFDDAIADVKITINLPGEVDELRVWAHGPIYGNIVPKDNKRIVATIKNLGANNLVDIRSTFDKDIIPLGTKLAKSVALPNILKEEEALANEANLQRKRAKAISGGILVLNVLWVIGGIALAISTYRKYDKEYKSSFQLEYHREFPAEYGPEIVEYLMKEQVTPTSLSAMILNIIRKKGFEVREEEGKRGKKNYVLVKTETLNIELTKEEQYVIDWLIDELGDGKEISFQTIKESSQTISSARDFARKYNNWQKLIKNKAISEEFYEEYLGIKIKGILYAVTGFIIAFFSAPFIAMPTISITAIILSIILCIYFITFKRRTIKGNDHFTKWSAFKKFLLDFGRFDEKELPEVVLWEKYLVYATVFGIASKVAKAMEIRIQDMNVDTTIPIYSNIYMNHYFTDSLTQTINTTKDMSFSRISESSSSSGSGFGGGGFSSGGGFGGGGSGGGGRGF